MISSSGSYGLWSLVFVNSAIFIVFAFSFFKPKTAQDWRSLGAFSAFVLALFTEMYGFPLTIYLLSGWLQTFEPDVDWNSHVSGHLPEVLLGWQANPHAGLFHIASFIFIGCGFWLLAVAWRHLWAAQRKDRLAVAGPSARMRHPQYAGFVLIMFGFLVQWPTILTLVMFPILVWMYVRLARHEEADSRARFGSEWDSYAGRVPAFVPSRLTSDRQAGNGGQRSTKNSERE